VQGGLTRAGCGYPHLRGGCGNPHCYACGAGWTCCGAGAGCIGAGRERVAKFFVRVIECWAKADELKSAQKSQNTWMYWSC